MNDLKNPRLTSNAKALRRNMTLEERHLWYDYLRGLPLMVHRQKVLGPYIVDFYVAAAKLVIEVDGSQHDKAAEKAKDRLRDEWLREQGIQVLRFSNYDVDRHFYGVCVAIDKAVKSALQREPLE